MALLPLIVLLATPAHAACPDPAQVVGQVEQSVLDADFEAARAAMAQVEAAFGCSGTADSELLARTWLAEGAMAHVEGDSVGRDQAFASAARLAPGLWTEAFGSDLQALWQAAAAAPTGTGSLALEGLQEDAVALVDGQPIQVPALLASGLYLVQADASGGPPLFTRIVLVPDDQTLVVRVDAPGTEPAAVSHDEPRPRKWPWFVAAGGTAVLAGTSAVLSISQDGAIDRATTGDELDAAYGRQRIYAIGSYGLAGASAVLVGIGLAW